MKEKVRFNLQIAGMNLKQIVTSKSFVYSIVAIIAVLVITLIELKLTTNGEPDVCSNYQMIFDATFFSKIVVLLSAMPAVTGFCTDWNTQYIRSVVGRTGVQKYAVHKVFACMTGTFLTVFIAYTTFALLLLFKYPMATNATVENMSCINPLGSVMLFSPTLCLIMRIICFSVSCVLWASFGLAFSVYIPNRFIACTIPLLFCYVVEILTFIEDSSYGIMPRWLLLPLLSKTSLSRPIFGNALIDFLYIIFLFVGLSLLVNEVFIHGVERRMRNELV